MVNLPKAPVHKILNESGASRVSDSATNQLCEILEVIGSEIAIQAKLLAEHAGRKTIKAEDVKLAYDSL